MEKLEKRVPLLLKKHPEGLALQDIAGELQVPRKDKNKLAETLQVLESDGVVRRSRNRYLLAPRSNVVRGRLVTVLRGFGFVTPEGGGPGGDIFIPARDSAGALQGDTVEVMVRESGRKGKPEGRILRILKKERKRILGIYVERGGSPYLAAFDSMAPEDIPLRIRRKELPPGRHDRRSGPDDSRARRPSWVSRTTLGWTPRSSSGATASLPDSPAEALAEADAARSRSRPRTWPAGPTTATG